MDSLPTLATTHGAAAVAAFEAAKATVSTTWETVLAVCKDLPDSACVLADLRTAVGDALGTEVTLGQQPTWSRAAVLECLAGVCTAAGVPPLHSFLCPLGSAAAGMAAAWGAMVDARAAVTTWLVLRALGDRLQAGAGPDPHHALGEVTVLATALANTVQAAGLVPGGFQADLAAQVTASVVRTLVAEAPGWAPVFHGVVRALCGPPSDLDLDLDQWLALVQVPGLPLSVAQGVVDVCDAVVGFKVVRPTDAATAVALLRLLGACTVAALTVPLNLCAACTGALATPTWGPPARVQGPHEATSLVTTVAALVDRVPDPALAGFREVVALGVGAALGWAADPNPGDLGPALVALVKACDHLETRLGAAAPGVFSGCTPPYVPVQEACAVFSTATWMPEGHFGACSMDADPLHCATLCHNRAKRDTQAALDTWLEALDRLKQVEADVASKARFFVAQLKKTGTADAAKLEEWRLLLDVPTKGLDPFSRVRKVVWEVADTKKVCAKTLLQPWEECKAVAASAATRHSAHLVVRDVWEECKMLALLLEQATSHPDSALGATRGVRWFLKDAKKKFDGVDEPTRDDMGAFRVFEAAVLRAVARDAHWWGSHLHTFVPVLVPFLTQPPNMLAWVQGLDAPSTGPGSMHHGWARVAQVALGNSSVAQRFATQDLQATLAHCDQRWGMVPPGLAEELAKREAADRGAVETKTAV